MATMEDEVVSLPEVVVNDERKITNPDDIGETMLIETIDDKGRNRLFLVINKKKDKNGKVVMYGCYENSLLHGPDLIISGDSYMTVLPFYGSCIKEFRFPNEEVKKRLKDDVINEVRIIRNKWPKDHFFREGGSIESLVLSIH